MHRTRTTIAAATAALALAAPASALASGSLLTGYSRPGGGEQQQLGPGLIPPKHGNGGLRAPAKTPAQSAPVGSTSPAPTPTPVTPTPTQAHPSPTPTATHHTSAPTPHQQPAPTLGPAATQAPAVALPGVVYPDASTHAGAGMPLSGSAMGIALLALLGMIALTIATRRVSQQQPSA